MPELSYYVADAFAEQRFAGNPAAVVLDADALAEEQMRAIAREFNLSETTFVSASPSSEATVGVRWFTPGAEVDMCGHGTIAAVHALVESGRFTSLVDEKGLILPVTTRSGILTVRCEKVELEGFEGFLVWLDLPVPQLKNRTCVPKLWAQYLGLPSDAFDERIASVQTQDNDILVFIRDMPTLLDARPDFKELARFSRQQRVRGWCLSCTQTLSASVNVHSRFFAPAVGVDEDAVTGSVHGPLAVHMVVSELVPLFGDTATLCCAQSDSTGRAGLVRAVVVRQNDGTHGVRIAGRCVTVMRGALLL